MSSLKASRAIVLTVLASSALTVGLQAQEAVSSAAPLQACYLPATGLVYLIGLEGLPEQCQGEDHVAIQLSLTTESALASVDPALIGTGRIADNAITSAKIKDKTIQTADLRSGAVTGRTLSAGIPLWRLGGNTIQGGPGTPAETSIGTLDDNPMGFIVNGRRALTIDTGRGFSFEGSVGSGTVPVTGSGTRMMWYPGKAAFRAGRVNAGQWDEANIGSFSTAMGENVRATGVASTAIGHNAKASGAYATAIGHLTTASANESFAFGYKSTASGQYSAAMGDFATAIGPGSTALGSRTTASGDNSTAMGKTTLASGEYSTAIGFQTTGSGDKSTAMGDRTIASGENSTAMGDVTTAGGTASTAMGWMTSAGGTAATAIGRETTASGWYSAAMGWESTAGGTASAAMGFHTTASGGGSTTMGWESVASAIASTAIGYRARAIGLYATAIGLNTVASGEASTAMGNDATASGESSIAMGEETTASGANSTALGRHASTVGFSGAFVYGDASTSTDFTAAAANEFALRASGGVRLRTATDLSTGCNLPASSGTWSCTSSRSAKENYQAEDGEQVLNAIAGLPIQSWNYIGNDDRHIGPFAEDFYAAFGLGAGEKTISTVDADGINMLAVQALEARTRAENEELRANDEDLRAENHELRSRLEAMENLLKEILTERAGNR